MNQNRPQMPSAAAALEKARPKPVSQPQPDHTKTVINIRRLIWLYLVLLVFEGSLRKWIVPQFSNPLLIIRDPIVILIYVLALRARVFSWNRFVISLAIIGILSVALSIFVLYDYFRLTTILEVTLYGFRSNFLHLPLIFVMANVLDEEDVKKIGWWTLLIMIPMSLIMAAQFQASPESFINRAAGLGEGQQIQAGGGKIRPAGTFSFISGPIFYVTVATAFLLYGGLSRFTYKKWLLLASGVAIVIAIAVSGSRSCVASVLVVFVALLIVLLVRPDAVNQFGRNLLIAVVAAVIISHVPIFKEGVGILSDRFTSSAEAAETSIIGGMVGRTLEGFTEVFRHIDKLPLSGYGLGIGTAGGARFLVGRSAFLLTENEWGRIVLESGPILGLAFLMWRLILTLRVLYLALRQLISGRILPILLCTSGFFALLNGTFGQPTSLGFAVVLSGLCLASMQKSKTEVEPAVLSNGSTSRGARPIPRRSDYASRLHGPPAQSDQDNGFVDR
jgi:hypothetical protein